jgi:hypothetical protein
LNARTATRDFTTRVEFAPGIQADDTPFKVGQSGWVSVDGVRPFRKGMETTRGFETYTTTTFSGKCRGLFGWRDNLSQINIAIGTHTNLYVEVGGGLYDIRPGGDQLTTEDGLDLLTEDGDPLVTQYPSGNEDGYGGSGYGTGAYGTGPYGLGSNIDTYPLTWTFGQYGQSLIANPRGWGIYQWSNDINQKAEVISGAPAQVSSILVTDRHVIAYGCNEELSGTFNPRAVRWCDFEDLTDWTTATNNNAGEYVLDDAGPIVRAMHMGPQIYIWTVDGLYVQQFLGQPGATYYFDLVEKGCGLVGPNAVTILGQVAYWMSPDLKFWQMPLGMRPTRLISPAARDIADNMEPAQQEKVYASTRREFNEVRWDYPDTREGTLENSRYVTYNVAERDWSGGLYARTAMEDQGVTQYAIGTTSAGNLMFEEKGLNANGAALSRSCKSGFFYVSESARVMMLRRLWPDFDDQQGNITLRLYSRMEPRGTETMHGPYTIRPTDTVIDLGNVVGAMFAVEWSSSGAPSFWRIGKVTFNGAMRGRGLR